MTEKFDESLCAMLRIMCDTVPVMLWAKDVNSNYIYANQLICDALLSAKDTDEPIGKDDVFFALRERSLHPDNPEWHTFGELCKDSDTVTIEAGKPMQFYEYGNIKGKFLYLDVRKAPLLDKDGKLIGIVGSARDITAERQVELERRKLSQAIEQAGESVIITDKQGTIEYVNPSFTKITGYRAEEVLGKNPRILKSGNQTAEYYECLWSTISKGETWQSAVTDRRKDGSQYPALMTISPITEDNGAITHYVGIQQDMTSHELLDEKFRQAQKMEALGTLVGGIAHDFNNMLAGMTGNLYLAKKKITDFPDVVKKLDTVEQLSFRASDMIKQLLTFARKGSVEMKPFGLVSFMKEVSKLSAASIPEDISFRSDFCQQELVVKGDATQLQQVLMNLINNARDALAGVEEAVISLKVEEYEADKIFSLRYPDISATHFACLSVSDNGSGIGDVDKVHIFEPFYTSKEVGLGTGLGLSMVYGAVQNHHGVIEVNSRAGEGSSFHIYLPLIEESPVAIISEGSGEAVQGDGEWILIVDDNADVRSAGREVLEDLGYQVLEASDGLEAIEVFSVHREAIVLILMDVIMPRLGGVRATKRIKALCPGVKVIFATGYDRDETLKSQMPSDEFVMLSKPYNIVTLSRMIREQLD